MFKKLKNRWASSARFLRQMMPICLALAFAFPLLTLASTTSGTILTPYAWGENTGWVNFAPTGGNIKVTDTTLTGYAWDSNYGWINLSPAQSGVKNDGEGRLSGSAWSTGGGYIDFYGIKINSSGKFTGIANGTVYGHLSFDCSQCNVTTDWRPVSVRTIANASNGPVFGSRVSPSSNYFPPNKSQITNQLPGTTNEPAMSLISPPISNPLATPPKPSSGSSVINPNQIQAGQPSGSLDKNSNSQVQYHSSSTPTKSTHTNISNSQILKFITLLTFLSLVVLMVGRWAL